MSDILSEREGISKLIKETLDEATDPWGVRVQMVELKDVMLPLQLQRAMAAEAEAAREARAKVIAAEGERDASQSLQEAARVIQKSPQALQVRLFYWHDWHDLVSSMHFVFCKRPSNKTKNLFMEELKKLNHN